MRVRKPSFRSKALFPGPPHNHQHCVAGALDAAENLASQHRLRFTPLRRRVLEIIAQSHRPLGAYDVLATLAKSEPKRGPVAPPTVYRALDCLRAHGLVHRIDSLNAFVACFAPTRAHRAFFFLCETCGRAAEIEDVRLAATLKNCAARAHFSVARETVEIAGRCPECAISTRGPRPRPAR